jgi:tRNA-specific 2-thiouridylase
MIAEYRAGRTPNPDVLCNRVIKFGVLWEYANVLGADAIATGHYARIEDGKLKTAADEAKDQSYFLWMLTSEELSHIRFPIGHLQKSAVRDIAEKAGLFTATKKDSQGICFLGDVDMREFLTHYIDEQPGDVVDEQGSVIGEHDGVLFYTLGERHGFRITASGDRKAPYYVIGKDIERNRLIVSTDTTVSKQGNTIMLREVNWLGTLEEGKRYEAQIRYHGARIPATVKGVDSIAVTYNEIIPPGQSLVIYDGDTVLGGGIIA